MKKTLLILALISILINPHASHAQGLEETIEDELDKGSLDGDSDLEAELDSGDEDADVAETSEDESEQAPRKTAPTDDVADEMGEEPEAEPTPATKPKRATKSKDIYAETLGAFDDQINSDFEGRLYRIFSKRPQVSDERWGTLVSRHSAGIYRVQKGDTLWDISSTFFGDGQFWPKLWSENSRLTNPHEITVGKGIAFVSGTEENAPAISVTDISPARMIPGEPIDLSSEPSSPVYPDDPEAQISQDDLSAGSVFEEQKIVGGRPEIPDPLVPRSSVLKRLPPSFIEPVPPKIAASYDSTGLDIGKRSDIDVAARQTVTAYISDGRPDTIGRVSEIELGEKVAGLLGHIFVKTDNEATVGQRFSVVSIKGNIGGNGPIVEVGGTIEIKYVINAEEKKYRAIVTDAVGPIEVGSVLIQAALPRVELSRRGSLSQVEAEVIGAQFDDNRLLMGQGTVIYLNKGKEDGLAPGQVIAVRAVRSNRRPTKFDDFSKSIAVAKIVHVENGVSTAMIVEAYEDVRVGDKTGGRLPNPEPVSKVLRAAGMTKNIEANMESSDKETYKEEIENEIDGSEFD